MDVRRSRGEFDRIRRLITMNPTSIGSRLSLRAGDHDEVKIFLQNCLVASRFNQKLREEERIHPFLKKNSREKFGPSYAVKTD